MTDPRQAAIDRVDALLDPWCGMPRDLCPCAPRPLPAPASSVVVRTLQRAMRSERLCEPLNEHAGPDTHGTPETAPWELLGPATALSPVDHASGGAA